MDIHKIIFNAIEDSWDISIKIRMSTIKKIIKKEIYSRIQKNIC